MIGQELMATLASLNFKQASNVFPYIRSATWATLSPSGKQIDGFSKILTKTDLEKLKQPNLQAKVQAAETILKTKWQECQPMSDHLCKCYGRLQVRTILWLLGKQKHGRETKEYIDQGQILEDFDLEVGEGPQAKKSGNASADLVVQDTTNAKPHQLALLQYTHIKVNNLYLGKFLTIDFVF